MIIRTYSRAALSMLSGGAAVQTFPFDAEVWCLLTAIAGHPEAILQWVPARWDS